MPNEFLEFPTGSRCAIVADQGDLTFDDLHRLRSIIRSIVARRFRERPTRILGCLDDTPDALLALLFLTELTDYMPINPNLSQTETQRMVETSGADAAVLSRGILADKSPHMGDLPCVVWDDVIDDARRILREPADFERDLKWRGTGRLILHTSGSTGTPKRVPISIASMNASARNIANGHALAADDHALNALPTFHIGALVDVMLAPFAAGGRISITDKRSPHDLVQALIDRRPTWFQVVPTLLRRLIEDVDPAKLADAGQSLRFIRSISAPVPADLKRAIEQAMGCPIIEMYGMTETAGQIATVSRTAAAFQPGSVGQPVGISLAIMDRYGNKMHAGQTGEVCVSGPTVFDGYEGTDKAEIFFEDYFRTGDLGKVDQDGYLFLQGRLKEMINVGGEKVSPHEIETAALDMPDVIEAAAYAVPHPTLGEQVGLTVATRHPIEVGAMKAFLETRLASFKCPNAIAMTGQLPRLANAKVDRLLLKRTAESAWQARLAGTDAPPLMPQSPQAQAIGREWVRLLKCRPPEGDDDFFDMGGDSLSATQLLLALETALGRQISPNQLFETPTFSGLVRSLSEPQSVDHTVTPRPVRYVQERTAGWPGQVVVPNGLLRSIGSLKPGHPFFWASQADSEIDGIVQTMGLRRPLYITGSLRRFKNRVEQDFVTVAQQLADEIVAIQPHGPIALGGLCGGAWVMHHTAEALQARGRDIRVLISCDYWPSREVHFPVLHCMSNCEINSGRVHYHDHTLAETLLHREGVLKLDVDSKHLFGTVDLEPHRAVINAVLDGDETLPHAASRPGNAWGLSDRLKIPKAKITVQRRPRIYTPGGTAQFQVTVTNTSDDVWAPTHISGLSLQIDLINLDGYMRKANVAYGGFDVPIAPGHSKSFPLSMTFPSKRVPLWFSCNLTSQGLTRFHHKAAGGHRSLVFPHPFKSSGVVAAAPD